MPSVQVPTLSYGLERVLFNPGVHWLRDLRTNVYNFDPCLRAILPPDQFNSEYIPAFVPASKDTALHDLALSHHCAFVTSTSSISQTMSLIYFVLSKMKPLNLDCLSQAFSEEPRSFTLLTRSPAAVLVRPHRVNLRSIVVEKVEEPENILQQLGQVMERLLTEPKDNFAKMLLGSRTRAHVRAAEAYTHTVVRDAPVRP